jgi:hypothetical protein
MMTDFIASGAMHSLKMVFQKKKERNVIIDPFSCLVKLSLIRYLEEGTKITIYQNRLNFNTPSYVQGIVRFLYGDNREDLHNILLPLQKCVEWFYNDTNPDMIYMFNNAVSGLKFLKKSYSTYATIQHTLDYYIIILMQRNTAMMTKMGFNSIDVDKLTNAITNTDTLPAISSKPESQSSGISGKSKKNHSNPNTNPTYTSTSTPTSTPTTNPTSTPTKSENPESITPLSATLDSQNYLQIQIQNQLRDIHKFLFELWNDREIGIVINLYRELESKSGEKLEGNPERYYIYNNIMQYCEMKENKLYQYIEQNSSVL